MTGLTLWNAGFGRSGREADFPRQCVGDDRVEIGALWSPGKDGHDLAVVGNQFRNVTGAARRSLSRDGLLADALDAVDHLHDRKPAPITAIHDLARRGVLEEVSERVDVGIGKVGYVNIVADAGSVGGWIVVAID